MTVRDYHDLVERFTQLSREDQTALLGELTVLAGSTHQDDLPTRSIRELRGLGKEIWQGIDAQEYVNQERASWDG